MNHCDNCEATLDGNIATEAEICWDCWRNLKAEVKRLRERLQIDPGGSDKIDELEQALQFSEAALNNLKVEWKQTYAEMLAVDKRLIIEVTRLRKQLQELEQALEFAKAKSDVCGGEWCAKNRAEGRGPCGACAWCCNRFKQIAQRAIDIAKMPYKDPEDVAELLKLELEL